MKLFDKKIIIACWFLQIAALIAIVYLFKYFIRYPVYISFFYVVILSVLWLTRQNLELIATKTGIVYRKTILHFWKKDQIIPYESIESINYSINYNSFFELLFQLPYSFRSNKFSIKLKDDRVHLYSFYLPEKRIKDFYINIEEKIK